MSGRVAQMIGGVLAAAVLAGCGGGGGSSAHLGEGLALYRNNDLENALSRFVLSSMDKPKDPAAKAWAAETLRRLERRDDAYQAARDALRLDPCNSAALMVVGDVFNPQFGGWDGKADEEVAWNHYLKAAECNKADGNAWLSIWIGAFRRGDTQLEQQSLTQLGETKFFTGPMLAYNRWMLKHLPENAVLFVNGDMDTYPALVLQAHEGFRRDVAVINVSLLNTEWYALAVAQRHGLPVPEHPFQIQRQDDSFLLAGTQWVRFWLQRKAAGDIQRPLTAAVTVHNLDFTETSRDNMRYAGPYFELGVGRDRVGMDLPLVAASLDGLKVRDFAGPFASKQDRSSVRQAYSKAIADNITAAGLRHTVELLERDRRQAAADRLAWTETFVATVPCAPHLQEALAEVRDLVESSAP